MCLCSLCDVHVCVIYILRLTPEGGWSFWFILIMVCWNIPFVLPWSRCGAFICNTRRRAVAENRSAAYLEQNKTTPNRCNLIKIFARTCSLAYFNRIYCHLIVCSAALFSPFLCYAALGHYVSSYISQAIARFDSVFVAIAWRRWTTKYVYTLALGTYIMKLIGRASLALLFLDAKCGGVDRYHMLN